MNEGIELLDELYGLLGELARRTGGPRTLGSCTGRDGWPKRGVYFFFEPGEIRSDGSLRVVRVGTHGLTAGTKSTLWGRLSQHRGQATGKGNHRGSVFRLHVGAALSARSDVVPVGTWGQRSSAPRDVREAEAAIEQAVSAHLGAMGVLWVPVDDEPGASSDRGRIEAGAIAALSRLSNPAADPPSPGWLGNHAARPAIRGSGLWNVNHVDGPLTQDFLPVLARWIAAA